MKSLDVKVAHQRGGEWCWAAAVEAVLGYYYPDRNVWNDIKGQEGIVASWHSANVQSGHPERPLRHYRCFYESENYDGDGGVSQALFARVKSEIDMGHPPIFYLKTADGNFRHAIVVYGYQGGEEILYKDPGLVSPDDQPKSVTATDVCQGWPIYGSLADTVNPYLATAIYTNVPISVGTPRLQ